MNTTTMDSQIPVGAIRHPVVLASLGCVAVFIILALDLWRHPDLGQGGIATLQALAPLLCFSLLAVGMLALVAYLKRRKDLYLEQLKQMLFLDNLTGFYQLRWFVEQVKHARRIAHRNQSVVAILHLDIDRYRRISEGYGLHAGEAVIAELAQRIKSGIRESDLACRQGGDDFLIMISGLPDVDAGLVADRLRRKVAETRFKLPGGETVPMTISIGIHKLEDASESLEKALELAQRSTQLAKRSGRNQVMFSEELPEHSGESEPGITTLRTGRF